MATLAHQFLNAWKLPRWRWAFRVAVLSGVLAFGVALWPPLQWILDGVTAVILFVVLGFRWSLVSAFAISDRLSEDGWDQAYHGEEKVEGLKRMLEAAVETMATNRGTAVGIG